MTVSFRYCPPLLCVNRTPLRHIRDCCNRIMFERPSLVQQEWYCHRQNNIRVDVFYPIRTTKRFGVTFLVGVELVDHEPQEAHNT